MTSEMTLDVSAVFQEISSVSTDGEQAQMSSTGGVLRRSRGFVIFLTPSADEARRSRRIVGSFLVDFSIRLGTPPKAGRFAVHSFEFDFI